MAMILPFLAGAAAIWYGMLGRRPACFALWVVTFGLLFAAVHPHMAGRLPFVL